jgi:hypothetical protein
MFTNIGNYSLQPWISIASPAENVYFLNYVFVKPGARVFSLI